MSNSDIKDSVPKKVDYEDTHNMNDYPTDPDTLNYNYIIGSYNPPRPFESDYQKTNYDITNFPKTNYGQFNSSLTNYQPVKGINYDTSSGYLPIDGDVALVTSNQAPVISTCQSPDMLYQMPRDPQYKEPKKYMCFNNSYKLLEITKVDNKWSAQDLSYSKVHVKWQGSQCKISTPDICNRDKLSEGCKATCFISPNESVNIKYQNNIWRVPGLEANAGSCSMTAISEDTAQDSYCNCNNVLERPNLKTKANFDKDHSGKFWCSNI